MKQFISYSKTVMLAVGLCVFSVHVKAQVAGDEDKDMLNYAKARDNKAIDEGKNGWWKESMKTHDQRIQWWKDAKFGMFVHWGISSLPGGEWKGVVIPGYSEHLMRKAKITRADYLDLAKEFNPVKFNADEWMRTAKRAGMGYIIVTAKHHDGFAMYPSKVSDFNITEKTPFKRDPMAELAIAAKKYGIRFGFYYSHAFDWEHPDAPGNDWELDNPGGDKLKGGRNWFDTHPEWLPKAVKYVDEKAIPQIKELITKYKPDILWFDTPHKLPLSENIRILKAIREVDPNVVINGRLVRGSTVNFGDYINTGDCPIEFKSPSPEMWEGIPTTNNSYGYSKNDNSHKSAKFFIQLLTKAASRGGNILLNVGPKGDGTIDTKDVRILDSIGVWTGKNRPTIFKVTKTPLAIPAWGVTTMAGNKLYLHVFNWPKDGKLLVGGLKSDVKRAYLYTSAKQNLAIKRVGASDQIISVPLKAPDEVNSVIVLDINGKIEADSVRRVDPTITTQFLAFDGNVRTIYSKATDMPNDNPAKTQSLKEQLVSWDFYAVNDGTYKVVVRYIADNIAKGAFNVKVAGVELKSEDFTSKDKGKMIFHDLVEISLKQGKNSMSIKTNDTVKDDLLLGIKLVPVIK